MAWHLTIECIALITSCMLNPDPLPPIKRDFESKLQCDRQMDRLNLDWRPAKGAWKMNCVRR